MVRTLLLALLLIGCPALAQAACPARQGFDAVACNARAFAHVDRRLDRDYRWLRRHLSRPRRQALTFDERGWIAARNQACSRRENGAFFADLACALRMTEAHDRFIEARFRACVRRICSDLDFYNTQDIAGADQGPSLKGYPAISKYHGPDAGYVAVYTHDPAQALYSVGDSIYVTGFIRLRGHYEGRIFRPLGYGDADISANPAFKRLTNVLFPGRRGGTWAGGDTGGFVTP